MPLPLLAHLWLAAAGLAPPELANVEPAQSELVLGELVLDELPPEQLPPEGSLGEGMPSELAPDEVDSIELSWERAQALRDAVAEDAGAAAAVPGPWVAWREIELVPVEGGLLLDGRWTIVAEQAGWLTGELLGPGIELRSATLDGKVAPVVALPGTTLLVAWLEGSERPVETTTKPSEAGGGRARAGRPRRPARDPDRRELELRVRAFVPMELDHVLELGLLPATRGRLRAAVPGRVPVPVVDEGGETSGQAAPARLEDGAVWSGASRLSLRLHDPAGAPPPARDTLAVAHVGVGLTVGDAEVRGRAHVQWELRQGELSRVRATLAGVGDDLTVEGPSVGSWSRTGDALDVELNAPVTGRVDLELRWTQAIGAGEETRLPLPRIEPEAWRSESSLQLARDGELEVIPSVEQGTAIAAAALPQWGQGLVEGTPTAAYEHGSSASTGHLELLRFVPVPGPPTVVDVADYTVATTDEGRVLMKVRYDVRNDRAAHLAVRPPPGLRIIGARVGQETALPSKGDDDAWRIPLRRSLETVDGLLSFPVEVIMLGEQEPWERRERRELPLPTLDAPIATARVTLYLPPRYRSRLEAGERNVVDEFDEGEGLTYGKGVSSDQAAVADALLEEAVQGYLSNDFEGAQEKLEQIEDLGVSNANVARLRSNIAVFEGEGKDDDDKKADVTIQRRVKEQAKARATEDFRRQEELIAEAEKHAQAGDYVEAERQYQQALDLGGKLAKLEQAESVEQVVLNTSVETQLGSVSKKKGKRSKKTLDTKFANTPAESINGGGGSSTPAASDPAHHEHELASRREPIEEEPLVTTQYPTNALPSLGYDLPPPIDDPQPVVASKRPAPEGVAGLITVETFAPGGDTNQSGEGQAPPAASPASEPAPPPDPAEPEPMPQIMADRYDAPPPPDSDADGLVDAVDAREEVMAVSRAPGVARRSLRRRRGQIKYKSADPIVRRRGPSGGEAKSTGNRRSFARRDASGGGGGGGDATSSATTVYDFEDDSLDGAVLVPDSEPMLASRGTPPPEQGAPRDAALPPPEVTASALSVVVPATGQAVLYQQLLIEANQTQVIEIHARRRLRR